MTYRRRTFPEVLDNLLTSITGGVSAEAHPFPPPGEALQHTLQQPPVASIVSIYGSRDGEPHRFRPDSDYTLAPDGQTVTWGEGAELPDPGTLVLVNYYPRSAQPVMTDVYVGSVVRTLAEAIALEMARLYAQLEVVYDSAFIESATGRALDNVVSLLGIERVAGGRPSGEIAFSRTPNSLGAITIPAGTRVINADGSVEYATTETVTLPAGQTTIRVLARDLEINDPVAADTLRVLPVPIEGIGAVTNPAPTSIDVADESDAELRTRARTFLHGSERATLGAIHHAIARQGVTPEVVESEDKPGHIQVTLHADAISPELDRRIKKAIQDAKPAGVFVTLAGVQAPAKVDLELRLVTATGLLAQDLRAAQRAVRAKIEDYFGKLPVREEGSINKLVGLALSVPGVEDVRLISARVGAEDVLDVASGTLAIADTPTVLGELHIADPNLPTVLHVTIVHPDASPPDRRAIQDTLSAAIGAINSLNATENAPVDQRTLTFKKLLHLTPLPGKPAGTLATFSPATAPDAAAPYTVTYALVLESGLSRLLRAGSAESHVLTPYERLSLGDITLQREAQS